MLAQCRGRGGLLCELAGDGGEPGADWIYQSRVYIGGTLQIVGIDPATGAHRTYEPQEPGLRGETGAWALASAPDGCIYAGTLPHAHLVRLEPRSGVFTDLGCPAPDETYFWEAVLASDGRLYFGTYPSARLIRLDPAMGTAEDLGRVDPEQQYARHLAAADGFVYAGVGSAAMRLVGFEVSTGQQRNLLPEEFARPGFAVVRRADDGTVYAAAGDARFVVRGWQLETLPETAIPPDVRQRLIPGRRDQPAAHRLRDGRRVSVAGSTVTTLHAHGRRSESTLTYAGSGMSVYRLGAGPDGLVYGSTVLPLHFFSLDAGAGTVTPLGELGGGEVYSFLAWEDEVLAAVYGGPSPLFHFDTRQPAHAGHNPRFVDYANHDCSWRPHAMIAGPGPRPEQVFIGAIAGYGRLGGPLVEWWPGDDRVVSHPGVVASQCVVSLAIGDGELFGGTTVAGGLGATASERQAVVFGWDVASHAKTFQLAPVSGATEITDLVVVDQRLIGIADQSTLFAVDLTTHRVLGQVALPFRGVIPNALAADTSGTLWGLAREGLFSLDAKQLLARVEVAAPEPITAGFVLGDGRVIFGCTSRIYAAELAFTDTVIRFDSVEKGR